MGKSRETFLEMIARKAAEGDAAAQSRRLIGLMASQSQNPPVPIR